MLFVYMPIIRREVDQFVTLWNGHYIRKQPARPSCAHGRPNKMYDYPRLGAIHSSIPINPTEPQTILDDLPEWGKCISYRCFVSRVTGCGD